jgi:hypothetical protein
LVIHLIFVFIFLYFYFIIMICKMSVHVVMMVLDGVDNYVSNRLRGWGAGGGGKGEEPRRCAGGGEVSKERWEGEMV